MIKEHITDTVFKKQATRRLRAAVPAQTELLKIPQVAVVLNVSRTAVYRLIGKGRLASVNIQAARRITRREINRFLTEIGA